MLKTKRSDNFRCSSVKDPELFECAILRKVAKFSPEHVHGIANDDVLAIELSAVNL